METAGCGDLPPVWGYAGMGPITDKRAQPYVAHKRLVATPYMCCMLQGEGPADADTLTGAALGDEEDMTDEEVAELAKWVPACLCSLLYALCINVQTSLQVAPSLVMTDGGWMVSQEPHRAATSAPLFVLPLGPCWSQV